MCFVTVVNGEMIRLRIAMHVHRGMKMMERRIKDMFCKKWRLVGDWPLRGMLSEQAKSQRINNLLSH
jgi:hypothetical protein